MKSAEVHNLLKALVKSKKLVLEPIRRKTTREEPAKVRKVQNAPLAPHAMKSHSAPPQKVGQSEQAVQSEQVVQSQKGEQSQAPVAATPPPVPPLPPVPAQNFVPAPSSTATQQSAPAEAGAGNAQSRAMPQAGPGGLPAPIGVDGLSTSSPAKPVESINKSNKI